MVGMTPRQIDRFCARLPAATRIVQWEGVAVFKVGGKMFCLIAPANHSIGLPKKKRQELGLGSALAGPVAGSSAL